MKLNVGQYRKRFTSLKAWEIPKSPSSCAPPGVWTNIDNDVTPFSRRTWTIYTIIGFWASDYLSITSYEGPSSTLIAGLSWREALINSIVGMIIIAIPMVLNGAIGARLHVPFAISVRASYGYYFSKFPIVTRLVTALFWHCIQTFSGSLAMYWVITAIWPSFNKIPNHIPENIGITTAQMVAHFINWTIQFPFMLIPPQKLKWFFVFKTIIVTAALVGVVAGMTKMSGSAGDLFKLQPEVTGSARSWLHLSLLMSTIGGWATMATNISDFTRYVQSGSKAQYYQVAIIPTWAVFVTMMAIIASSAGKIVYGQYMWSPMDFSAEWIASGTSKGRAATFFFSFSWVVAMIGTNLSANIISAANDLTSLFPKYFNIRRSAAVLTFIAGWVMQPWKIVFSAGSLISFMAGVSLFLVPIFTVIIVDYWIVKKQNINVSELYNPNGIYHYTYGVNWRAAVAWICSVAPNLPGLAASVNAKIKLPVGAQHFADLSYFYGFFSAFAVYYFLNYFFPHHPSLIEETVFADEDMLSESVEDVQVSVVGDKQFS
ncbi:allantoin permease [[Candida] jaroonii]|uniref:Allantoin permease n=1 Tax=[Candida] jaroonii TaxID=467808 RepID=A0ACA9YF72_9ASCO|nr:allantoin permease [[Candida] jaroonii]